MAKEIDLQSLYGAHSPKRELDPFTLNARNLRNRQLAKMMEGPQGDTMLATPEEPQGLLDTDAILASPLIPLEQNTPVTPMLPAAL